MKDKLKAIFDLKTTWTAIGAIAGALGGAKAAGVAAVIGNLVMSVL
jgi:hypothetical protein